MANLAKYCTLFCSLLILCCGNAGHAATPFDDFTGPRIDTDKWHGQYWNSKGLEVVREVSNGKFISRLGGINSNITANRLNLSDPNSVQTLSAKITLIEAKIHPDYATTTSAVVAQLEGYFYSDQDGDVWAGISLAYDGNNWKIFYEFWAQSSSLYKTDFNLTIEPGTEYLVSIQYDGNNNFIFKVNNESHTLQGPAYVAAPNNPYRALTTKIWPHNGPGAGYISATFDDVNVNGSAYDDFSTTHLDPLKWWNGEIVREIRDGKLQMNVQNMGKEKTDNPIYLNDEHRTNFFQADLTLSSATEITESDIEGFIKVYGSFFNAQHDGSSTNPYNWSEGEIWAGSGLNYNTNGPPRPAAYVYRCDDRYCSTGTYLFRQNFTCNTLYNTPVTMSVEKSGNTLIFHCDNEKLSYQLSGTLYPSNWNLRKIRATIISDKNVNSYLKATVDNVYVHKQSTPWNLFLPAILGQHSKK